MTLHAPQRSLSWQCTPWRFSHPRSAPSSFADLRGYTRFTAEHGDEAAASLITRFAEITAKVVTARGGRLIELRGDEALVVFASARGALRAAADLQTHLIPQSVPLGVGIGVDAGEAVPVSGGYRGAAVNLASRLCSLAGPGEILVSQGVAHLARRVRGLTYRDRGRMPLKGFDEPVGVLQLVPEHETSDARLTPPTAQPNHSVPAFGRLLHRLRRAAGLTQEQLAERATLSARAISDLERGAKTRPHRSTVDLLAEGLELTSQDRAELIAAVPSGPPAQRRAMLHVAEGEWTKARTALDQCTSRARALGDLQVLRHAQWLAADEDLLMGRPDLARARLETLLDRPGSEETDVILILPLLAWAHLQMGDSPQAEEVAAGAVRRARECREPDTIIDALRIQGIVHAESERCEEAIACLEQALSLARALTYPYREARVLYEWGRLYTQRHEPDVARVQLRAALTIFRRLGARPSIERTEQVLTTIG